MKDWKVYVQKFGRYLSGMVMPNIGAFIAWGLITAFFIPSGWTPNATISSLVGPMIFFLLPMLIASTGGRLVHGQRGAVIGVVATMGVIIGALAYPVGYDESIFNGSILTQDLLDNLISDGLVYGGMGGTPMFLGAMIMAPLAAYVMKLIDRLFEDKVKAGFEMLVNNFSLGIAAMFMAILGLLAIGPVVEGINSALGAFVEIFVNAGLLPLASIFIEPAKVLFLNNAINHGILGPLGINEVAEHGKSIFFLLETNPGPGLGILLAYWLFGKGMAKNSAPGSIIIHFFGGIHEIYFPYILMKPILILAAIAGGATGVLVFQIFDAGLVATPAPGSIFALLAMTPKGNFFAVIFGVLASTTVSFLVASFFLKRDKSEEQDFEAAQEKMVELKGKKGIQLIVFACDAGMGSSAMGASTLRSKLKKAGVNIKVAHYSIDEIPLDAKLVVTHESLKARAEARVPNSEIITITNFVGAPEYDQLVDKLK